MAIIDFLLNPYLTIVRGVFVPRRLGDDTLPDNIKNQRDKIIPKDGQVGDFPAGFGESHKDVA
jgi:hypothetical protein